MGRLQTAVVSNFDFGPALPTTGENAAIQVPGAIAGPLQFVVKEGADIIGRLEDQGSGNNMTVQVSADGVNWTSVTDAVGGNNAWFQPPANGAAHPAIGSVTLDAITVAKYGHVDFGFGLRPGLDKYLRFSGATARGIIQLRGDGTSLQIQKI